MSLDTGPGATAGTGTTPAHRRMRRPRVLAGLVVVAAASVFSSACGGGSDAEAGAGSAADAAASQTPGENPAPDAVVANQPTDAAAASEIVTRTLDALNAARSVERSCASERFQPAPALAWNGSLEQAAAAHAEWMQATDTVSHTGAGGSSAADRVTAAGYRWQTVGENIAAGQRDVAAVVQGWLESPGHCRNIMNPAFVDVALAVKQGTSANGYASYWTLVLARPR